MTDEAVAALAILQWQKAKMGRGAKWFAWDNVGTHTVSLSLADSNGDFHNGDGLTLAEAWKKAESDYRVWGEK